MFTMTLVGGSRVKRDAMFPEICPACGVPWGDLADDHSAITDWRAAFAVGERVVCQGTVSAAEYAALDGRALDGRWPGSARTASRMNAAR